MSIAGNREERRRLMDAVNEKMKADPELLKKLKATVVNACRFALNGAAPVLPVSVPPVPAAPIHVSTEPKREA